MTSWRTRYWRLYNILVRALGLVSLVSGVAFIVLGGLGILRLGLLAAEGSPGLVTLGVGLILAALGGAILIVPAFRTDLGDVWWQFDPFGAKAQQSRTRRAWWTGDRLNAS
jgi:hypothetical protein